VSKDEELRKRILDVAAQVFAENGYGGTKLPMVAERAGVTTRTVKRLTGGRAQLFAQVITGRLTSEAGDRLAAAAADPLAEPPLAVLLEPPERSSRHPSAVGAPWSSRRSPVPTETATSGTWCRPG